MNLGVLNAKRSNGSPENDIVFNNKTNISVMQAIIKGTYCLRLWRLIEREDIQMPCHILEIVAMEVFTKSGWRFSHWIYG